jgi:hypothetical protein
MLGRVRKLRDPFTLDEARSAGVSFEMLRGKAWRRIGRGLYCSAGWREDSWQLLHAWHRHLRNVVFTGLSAAWLHGFDVDPCHPVECAAARKSGTRSRRGIVVRHISLDAADVVSVRGLEATSPERTLSDLRKRLSRVEFLVVADAALKRNLGRFDELAEPAESPMETRLRWVLIQAGLPKPEVQISLHDTEGRFVGRADLYYPQARLAIEYDGVNHRDRLVDDDRRQNDIIDAGYRLLRFTAADLAQRPDSISALVRRALGTQLH